MAKYNALYLAQKEILNKNLIANVNLTQSLEGSNITETSSTSSSESNGKNLFQDSPQGQISQTDIDNQIQAQTNI